MNRQVKDFLINKVGVPKHLVFILRHSNRLPELYVKGALIRASIYLKEYHDKVGEVEYEKSMSKLRHPAFMNTGRK